jgi:cleavage and polyadenylation specificity factor subunit 2
VVAAESVLATVRQAQDLGNRRAEGGNVLLPTDTAGRVLELALVLEQHWAQHRLPYTVAVLSHQAANTFEFVRVHVEWMSDAVQKTFENARENSFDFKYE